MQREDRRSRALLVTALWAIAGCGGAREIVPDAGETPPAPDAGTGAEDAGAQDSGARDGGPLACTPAPLEPAPADVLWVVDTTASWETRTDRYAGAVDAMIDGVSDWTEAEHALAIFPRFAGASVASCETSDYESADIAWGATAQVMRDELALHPFAGDSSLGPALAGAIGVARDRAEGSRWRSTHLVLVTDASPATDETCDASAWEEVAAIAGAGFDAGRHGGVHVHVLSVIGRAIHPDHPFLVDAIADAGGGRSATVNGSREDVERSARGMLQDLEDRAAVCTRMVPPGESAPDAITIRFPDGTARAVARVPDASACAGTEGGFYVDDLDEPSTITLCSGRAGVGGVCELTVLQARTLGAPRFELDGACAR